MHKGSWRSGSYTDNGVRIDVLAPVVPPLKTPKAFGHPVLGGVTVIVKGETKTEHEETRAVEDLVA